MFPPCMIVILTLLPILSLSQNVTQFNECSTKLYSCGPTVRLIGYPFWGQDRPSYCGLNELQLTCIDDVVTTLQISNTTFRILQIDQFNTKITLDVLWGQKRKPDACLLRQGDSVNNTMFEHTMFSYIPDECLIIGFYLSCLKHDAKFTPIRKLNCSGVESESVSFIDNVTISLGCECEIRVPVLRTLFEMFINSETMPIEEVLTLGFHMEYSVDGAGICSRCETSGGTCWSNFKSTPSCLCPDGIPRSVCNGSGATVYWKTKLTIGIGSAAILLIVIIFIIIYCKMKSSSNSCVSMFKHKTEDDKSVEAFVTQYGSLTMKRYKYVDIKRMTNSFQVKLGQGGFGTVFKGKLSNGRLVAVKILNSSKESGQEFINEVASIGRTSHINIVTLLGFCFDYKKRALVYEFMPNGSLEKYIYSHVGSPKTSDLLGVEKLYEVALGIARGLDYLHRGCTTRILHLDIKPHNILLDEDFCPKIADFGLAKLYSRKESIVSMLEARGTIGYIAPEVFSRNFGGVSHKSDVYSYGMLILEMVGGRKNVDACVGSGHTSEIYFPYWIYNRLKKDEYLIDGVTTTEENDYARKMTIVGLWCIQTDPRQRPSINEVIEMLEGSSLNLEVPPKPFFSTPPQSPAITFEESHSEIVSS